MNKKTTSMEGFVEALGVKNLSVAQWARQNNFKPHQVYGLLRGHLSGRRGMSRQILTRMGVKPPPVIRVRAKGSK